MSYYYLIINGINQVNQEDYQAILSLFSEMMYRPSFKLKTENLIIIAEMKEDISFYDVISNTNQEFYLNLSLYESIEFQTIEELLKDLKNKSSILEFNTVYLNEKILIYNRFKPIFDEKTRQEMLKEFYYDQEFLHMIKVFLEKNQNSSEASKALYLHRNTLNNRIEKFYKITGYDLRKFEDAALIYIIVKDC
ncbi:MAG: helix-turn-helix domain-containing protein [Acholeplasmataceae bacterium]